MFFKQIMVQFGGLKSISLLEYFSNPLKLKTMENLMSKQMVLLTSKTQGEEINGTSSLLVEIEKLKTFQFYFEDCGERNLSEEEISTILSGKQLKIDVVFEDNGGGCSQNVFKLINVLVTEEGMILLNQQDLSHVIAFRR